MKSEFWIAKRLYYQQPNQEKGRQVRKPAVTVALIGVAIGLLVMIITVFVVAGFKREVAAKVAGFGAHIQVVNFDNNSTYEMQPVCVSDSLLAKLRALQGVRSAVPFATKPGIIRTEETFAGIILLGKALPKGDTLSTDWAFFEHNLTEGHLPTQPQEVLISTTLAHQLQLKVQDPFFCYFVQEQIRARKMVVSGLYNTDFADYDEHFIVGDMGQVQTLNLWESNQVSGVEILVKDLKKLDEVTDRVYFATANQADEDGNFYYTQNMKMLNPAIFAWLDLLDTNVVIIIVLMLLVSGFTIISGLLILILDSIPLIGTLRALGATNAYLRRIFLCQASFLVGKGMLWGNALALLLCALQYFFHLVPLDPSAYYVSFVPIDFAWGWWALLNVGCFLISLLTLLAPSWLVAKIAPAQILRFE